MTHQDISLPFISIVVSIYNGEPVIRDCIESLLALDYPKEQLEVLIIDNNSTDRTRAIVQQYPVTLLSESVQGCSAARNTGIREAKGDIIAATDADCVVGRHWAREIAKSFQDEQVHAVLGFADGINKNIFARFAQDVWEESWFHKDAQGYSLRRKGIDTRNCAIRTQTLESYGYFDPTVPFCADLELSIRLNRAQCHIVFNPLMKVWHKNPTSLRVMQEKGRKQMAAILCIMRGLPEGISSEDVPFPRSAFYGIAARDMGKATLACVLALLRSGRCFLLAMVRLSVALKVKYEIAYKLYKVYLGMSYDIAILQAKRTEQGR